MDINQAYEIIKNARERHIELSNLLPYAPFIFDFDKRDNFVNYIQEIDRTANFAGDFFDMKDEKDEFAVDAKEQGLKQLEKLKKMLDDGDKNFPTDLVNDIEEARLYKKRYENPAQAYEDAKKIYRKEEN